MRTAALLLALCTQGVHAQSWFNDEAEWHYAYGNSGAVIGYVHGTIGGDTLLAGQVARKLELHRFAAFIGTTQVYEEEMQDLALRYADDIVWLYVPHQAAFDTLYKMNAIPGERWRLAELNEYACGPESYMQVTDTGTTTRFGPELRWLAVDVQYFGDWTYGVVRDTIVERIGSLWMYIQPHDMCLSMVDGSEGGLPLCYQDGELDYQWRPDVTCDRSLAVAANTAQGAFNIYPSPATDQVYLELPDAQPTRIALFDGQGRLLSTQALTSSTQPIDVSALASGAYVLRAYHKEGFVSRPFLKH